MTFDTNNDNTITCLYKSIKGDIGFNTRTSSYVISMRSLKLITDKKMYMIEEHEENGFKASLDRNNILYIDNIPIKHCKNKFQLHPKTHVRCMRNKAFFITSDNVLSYINKNNNVADKLIDDVHAFDISNNILAYSSYKNVTILKRDNIEKEFTVSFNPSQLGISENLIYVCS